METEKKQEERCYFCGKPVKDKVMLVSEDADGYAIRVEVCDKCYFFRDRELTLQAL